MGAKTEALAKQFEAKARDALATLERLSDADWTKVTEAEQWSVAAFNARHAKDYANCNRAETIALYRKGVAVAAAGIRALNDHDLAKTGTLVAGAPPMTAEQVIAGGLLHHIDEHVSSIRKTVGQRERER
jgi:hypothetical protein